MAEPDWLAAAFEVDEADEVGELDELDELNELNGRKI